MLGDAEEWFYRRLGGIDVDFSRPVAEQIVLHPVVVGKIAWVRTSYQSAAGMIRSSWQRGAHETVYRFTVPANAMATIEIDSANPSSATVNGVAAAKALLDAGASANTGWMELDHEPRPTWEAAIYGAAGIAQHPELTRLLLERGADPNDGETPYHVVETYDNTVMKILVESGRLNDTSMTTLLLRKTDWHDYDGIKWLLEHGADPNRATHWGRTAFHHAVLRDNSVNIIEVLMEHGADPMLVAERPDTRQTAGPAMSGVAMAARRGRGDVLDLMERRGIAIELQAVERLIAACARNDSAKVRTIAEQEPELVRELVAQGGKLLAEFASVGNTDGARHLLDLGVDVSALTEDGDPYFDVAKNSTALHSAVWRAWPSTVKFLLERGAPVDVTDEKGRTPLMLAVRTCVDSYWKHRRTPESVEALLNAGATVRGVEYPSGYAEVDELLHAHGAKPRE